MSTKVKIISRKSNGITLFELKNEELRIIVTNLGCHVLSIFSKDRDGNFDDVVLGFDNVEDCRHDGSYMGAVVGRVANRIRGAQFVLNDITYDLASNNGSNHLHGGSVGFNQRLFGYTILPDGIRFSYLSPDGEEGYPGNLRLTVLYQLVDDTFRIQYHAVSDQDTLVNVTNHMYFNLSGGREKIYHHQLKVCADQIACVDSNCLPDGTVRQVQGTPFDFREFCEIGARIEEDDIQLKNAGGYDHAFLLNAREDQVVLRDLGSGRAMTISTTLPTVQVYTGNFLAGGCNGKQGKPYENRDGVALETQFLPDSIHIESDPSVILRKGEEYQAETRYRFTAE